MFDQTCKLQRGDLMRMITMTILLATALAFLLTSCGSEKQTGENPRPAEFLVGSVDSIGLARSSEIRIFVGDSLWEYINGGAELYHLYSFSEVATAYYLLEGTELVVDVYNFQTAPEAFGLYSMLRPEQSTRFGLGLDDFGSTTNLVFVKGTYVVMLTGFEQTDAMAEAIKTAGPIFEQLIPGTTDLPADFELFPDVNGLPRSEMIYAESYLGQVALEDVFTQRYGLESDTVVLFLTSDSSGAKFIDWKEQVADDLAADEALRELPYDDGIAVMISHSYYGNIVAGLKNGKLMGMVGYQDKHREYLARWLESLSRDTR
jgi:hypothetical protein